MTLKREYTDEISRDYFTTDFLREIGIPFRGDAYREMTANHFFPQGEKIGLPYKRIMWSKYKVFRWAAAFPGILPKLDRLVQIDFLSSVAVNDAAPEPELKPTVPEWPKQTKDGGRTKDVINAACLLDWFGIDTSSFVMGELVLSYEFPRSFKSRTLNENVWVLEDVEKWVDKLDAIGYEADNNLERLGDAPQLLSRLRNGEQHQRVHRMPDEALKILASGKREKNPPYEFIFKEKLKEEYGIDADSETYHTLVYELNFPQPAEYVGYTNGPRNPNKRPVMVWYKEAVLHWSRLVNNVADTVEGNKIRLYKLVNTEQVSR